MLSRNAEKEGISVKQGIFNYCFYIKVFYTFYVWENWLTLDPYKTYVNCSFDF